MLCQLKRGKIGLNAGSFGDGLYRKRGIGFRNEDKGKEKVKRQKEKDGRKNFEF